MIFTERMKQLVAVVLDHDADAVTRTLLKQGVLDLVRVTELEVDLAGRLTDVAPEVSEAMIGEIRKRIETFLDMIDEQPGQGVTLDVDSLQPVDLEATTRELDGLAKKVREARDRQEALQQEILKLRDIQRQVELFGDVADEVGGRSHSAFLSIMTGSVRTAMLPAFQDAFQDMPCVLIPLQREADQTAVLLIVMKRDETRVGKVLDQFGWADVSLPEELSGAGDEIRSELERKLSEFRKAQAEQAAAIETTIRKQAPHLQELWANLRLNELFVKIQAAYSKTAHTVIFSGWLPSESQAAMDRAIRKAAGGRCYIEWQDPKPGTREDGIPNAPVRFRESGLWAPFQMLVRNFTIPEYGTVDPTPFVAVTYLAMFGLMFGDAGHGAVLLAIGLAGLRLRRGPRARGRDLFGLIAWCGGAAIAAGVLFGSYFGMPWLPPLWFDYHGLVMGHAGTGAMRSVYDILKLTVYFGIAVIGCGLILNWINLVAKRKWLDLITDKAGVAGGWAYAGGVYLGFYFVSHDYRELPAAPAVFALIGLPCLLLGLRPLTHHLQHPQAAGGRVGTFFIVIMEWVIEILELVSGYLANTLSFMRVAGLGIAHVSLVAAFMTMADMVSGGGSYGIGAWIVLILGHLLIIALEGLSAGIQSLRLNYYEFFSKYLSGSGRAYAPVSLGKPR